VKTFFKINIVPVVLLAIVLGACNPNEPRTIAVSAAEDPNKLEATADQMKSLRTIAATMQTIPSVEEATGKVSFNEDAITPVYSPYIGRVSQLLAKPGDSISKGASLLVIDSPDVVDAENDFLSGRAALSKAQAILKQAGRTRDRVQKLLAGEAASP
jgi:membrane fusion protein, heavy metal efflux system